MSAVGKTAQDNRHEGVYLCACASNNPFLPKRNCTKKQTSIALAQPDTKCPKLHLHHSGAVFFCDPGLCETALGQVSNQQYCIDQLGHVMCAGGNNALIQLGEQGSKHWSMKGFKSYLAWKSAYLTRLGNAQNRFYVLMNWLTTSVFGRDMSRW